MFYYPSQCPNGQVHNRDTGLCEVSPKNNGSGCDTACCGGGGGGSDAGGSGGGSSGGSASGGSGAPGSGGSGATGNTGSGGSGLAGSTGMVNVGNPINAGTGNKWQHEIDLPQGPFGLGFERNYNSNASRDSGPLGAGWTHSYSRSSTLQALGTWVLIRRPDGKEFIFNWNAGAWTADADVSDRLEEVKDSTSVRTGWRYTTADLTVESYDAAGRLVAIADRTGLTQTLVYSDSSTPVDWAPTAGLLLRVSDAFGRALLFRYDANSRLSTLTDPAGGVYRYGYDANNHLVSVTYPDGSGKTYHYENPAFPQALTGITDENGNRFASYRYDDQGRAIASEHAGGAGRVSLAYLSDGATTVTDALGTARTYQFQTLLGVVKSTGQSQPGGSGCNAASSALSYDANGNIASRTDFNGHRTDYVYDLSRNLETRRTEGLTATGATTSATRMIDTLWHPTFRLPIRITLGNQQTRYVYNSQGELTEQTVTDLATNVTRRWQTTYSYGPVPGVLRQKVEDGPRTDVADLTTYAYYPADAACAGGHLGCRGQLQQLTDALGHRTQLSRYNAHGQVEQLIDPNGLVTTLTYDARQRLTSLDSGGETTAYSYDPAGQLLRVTRPDGSYLAYRYDAAHRLINIQDQAGNSLTYTLDAIGHRIKEEAHDPNGQLARSQSRVYDALSRLQQLILPQ